MHRLTMPSQRDTRRHVSVLVFVALAVCAAATIAQGQISVGVAPLRADHAVQPGQVKTDIITINNLSPKPQRMQASISDWSLGSDGIPVFMKRGKSPEFSMSEWIEVNPTEFEVPAGGSQVLRYTLEVPAGTPEGGYRTSILIESVPEQTDVQRPTACNINARIGVMIYDRVGNAPILAEVASQKIVQIPDAPAEAAVELEIRNNGRVHFRVSGECTIEDRAGRVLETLRITDSVVLPQSVRNITLPVSTRLPDSGYRILSRIDAGVPELLEIETLVNPQRVSN